jgi:hypothetical protein
VKKDKSKLVPKIKTVTNKYGTTFQRRYWVKADIVAKSGKSIPLAEFMKYNLQIGKKYYSNIDALIFSDVIVRSLVPDISHVDELRDPSKNVNGVYYPATHHIELSQDVLNQIKALMFLVKHTDKPNKINLSKKANTNLKDINTAAFIKFTADIATPLHEAIHALGRAPDFTVPFEEGITEILTNFMFPHYFSFITNGKFKFENFIDGSKDDYFILSILALNSYTPYISRLVALARYIGLTPEEFVSSLVDYRLGFFTREEYEPTSFLHFLIYLKDKFRDRIVVDTNEINEFIVSRKKINNMLYGVDEITDNIIKKHLKV